MATKESKSINIKSSNFSLYKKLYNDVNNLYKNLEKYEEFNNEI